MPFTGGGRRKIEDIIQDRKGFSDSSPAEGPTERGQGDLEKTIREAIDEATALRQIHIRGAESALFDIDIGKASLPSIPFFDSPTRKLLAALWGERREELRICRTQVKLCWDISASTGDIRSAQLLNIFPDNLKPWRE